MNEGGLGEYGIESCDCRDLEAGEVRVYPGKLQVSESFCIVPVTVNTTVADLIEEALQKFGLENFKSEDYRCSKILLDRGGKDAGRFVSLCFVDVAGVARIPWSLLDML